MEVNLINGGIYLGANGAYLVLLNDNGLWQIRYLWYGRAGKADENETGVTGDQLWAQRTVKDRESTLIGTLEDLGRVLEKALRTTK